MKSNPDLNRIATVCDKVGAFFLGLPTARIDQVPAYIGLGVKSSQTHR